LRFDAAELPNSAFLHRDAAFSLLDVAAGSGSVDVFKFLVSFHNAKPGRDTFCAAVSSGNVEIIRIVWDSLSGRDRVVTSQFLEVAADFHRAEILMWLFDNASVGVRERFIQFALRRHLADSLLAVLKGGYLPWSRSSREAASRWPPASVIPFRTPPTSCNGIPPETLLANFAAEFESLELDIAGARLL
jgi:hypothetical protein